MRLDNSTIERTIVYCSVSCVCEDCMRHDKGIKYFHPVLDTVIFERAESDSAGLSDPAHTTAPTTS